MTSYTLKFRDVTPSPRALFSTREEALEWAKRLPDNEIEGVEEWYSENEVEKLNHKITKLEKFCLSRCWCKSIPGESVCSYCAIVRGELLW